MSRLDHLAETVKLGRAMGLSEDELEFLGVVDHHALRALREHLTDVFFEDTRPMLSRAAKASRLLPIGLLARIGQRVFGALLCARMAGLMDTKRAIEVAQRMPDPFLADVSMLLDPRRAEAVIAGMPPDRVVAVAKILAARDDHITLARFVGYLPDSTISAVIDAVPDDNALLRTAFFLESKSTLDRLVGLVRPERLRDVVAMVARAGDELWTEALSLMTHVGERWQRHIGDLAAEEDDEALTVMVQTTHRFDLWAHVLPLFGAMNEPAQRRFMGLPIVRTPGFVRAIVTAADRTDSWGRLLPLALHMGDEMRRHVAAELEALGAEVFRRVLPGRAVLEDLATRVLPGLAAIAEHLSEAARAELEDVLGQQVSPPVE